MIVLHTDVPNNNIKGKEMSQTYITKLLVKQFKEIHGSKYDYSLVCFDNDTPVKIKCADHGVFQLTPHSHLAGQICPVCAAIQLEIESLPKPKIDFDPNVVQFIYGSVVAHGDKYDYQDVIYRGPDLNVSINCPEHGPFECTPYEHEHLNKGCPVCSPTRTFVDVFDFIRQANMAYKFAYGYTAKTVYVDDDTPVTIICYTHGQFECLPVQHVFEHAECPKCKEILDIEEVHSTTYKLFSKPVEEPATATPCVEEVHTDCSDNLVSVPTSTKCFKKLGKRQRAKSQIDLIHSGLKKVNLNSI